MSGILDGVKVLDLSWGVSGPMVGMLLADQGAAVTKVDRPGGDRFETLSGYRVWQRSKARCTLDLRSAADRDRFLEMVSESDVLLESFAPGTTARLGIAYTDLSRVNEQLIYCSITGYGSTGGLADRPGYDALVAARSGQMWEARGVTGGTISRLSGQDGTMPGIEAPDGLGVGAPRPGPLFSGIPWVSLGAFYLGALAVSAALRARERTGRGQWVQTSLLQGALVTATYPWQKVEDAATPGFQSWVIDPRAPKGFFKCADGRWIHQWTPLPAFMLNSAAGEKLAVADGVTSPRQATERIGFDPSEMIVLHHVIPQMAEAAARFTSTDWTEFAAGVGVPLQPVRSPEEALDDPALLADGCVSESEDAELGTIRHVGRTYSFHRVDRDTGSDGHPTPWDQEWDGAPDAAPLAGMLVLDLGLAAAGPFGAQLLGELGAEVIKVHQRTDEYWLGTHIGMSCNRGKRSLAIDLKDADAYAAFLELVARADVVHTNMRYPAAERLRVDYETLRLVNPHIIYCHTRGFEHGARDTLPGNDQTGAALAGTDWLDGGLDRGGVPIWPVTSLGDTGNGLLSAIAVVQAIFHRDRTGEGQFVDTSIMYAHLLNTSMAWKTADGRVVGDRPRLDAAQLGWSALYRLYQTSDGWLCVAALTAAHWEGLCRSLGVPGLAQDARFSDPVARAANDEQLADVLTRAFMTQTSKEWAEVLDDAGVPAEITHEDSVSELFENPDLRSKGWITSYQHPRVGRMESAGSLFEFSATPTSPLGSAPLVGQHSRDILTEIGIEPGRIDDLIERAVVFDVAHGAMREAKP